MADDPDSMGNTDENDTTPLMRPQGQTNAGFRSLPFSRYRWYFHPGLIVILLLTVLVFLSSFISLWTLLSFIITLTSLFEIYRRFIYPIKPQSLPVAFLATQLSLGTLIAPVVLMLFFILLFIVMIVLFALTVAIIVGIFFSLYPAAGEVLTDDLNNLNSSSVAIVLDRTARFIVPPVATISQKYTGLTKSFQTLSPSPSSMLPQGNITSGSQIWEDLVNAGAPPPAIVTAIVIIAITAFSYITVTGLLGTSLIELTKWTLFIRYRSLASNVEEAARNLGVSGLVVIASTGTFGLVYVGFLESQTYLFNSTRSFYAAIIFVFGEILDAIILLSTQLIVTVTYADIHINGKNRSLPAAFRLSVISMFLLGVIKIPPPNPVANVPVVVFVVLTAIRIYGAYLLSSKSLTLLNSALDTEQSVP